MRLVLRGLRPVLFGRVLGGLLCLGDDGSQQHQRLDRRSSLEHTDGARLADRRRHSFLGGGCHALHPGYLKLFQSLLLQGRQPQGPGRAVQRGLDAGTHESCPDTTAQSSAEQHTAVKALPVSQLPP
eukprot:TRINITY_DN4987_c0_g1_i1.p4 TRINITY_DN4987_c0_g1~~TRINITY_DN4987_c0_g1_i1.p4  ORF type:complete len:127 (-),score=5.59 TRINITY_DN4987_c0_g1_i1:339-719(-)